MLNKWIAILLKTTLVFFLTCGLFFVFCGLSWVLGDPVNVPSWLVFIAQIVGTGYQPNILFHMIFLIIWILLILGLSGAIFLSIYRVFQEKILSIYLSFIPLWIILGMALLIMPVESNKYGYAGQAQVAAGVTFSEYLFLALEGTVVIITVFSIFFGMALVYFSALFLKPNRQPGGLVFFFGILIGVFLSIVISFNAGDYLSGLNQHLNAVALMFVVFSVYATATVIPLLLKNRIFIINLDLR